MLSSTAIRHKSRLSFWNWHGHQGPWSLPLALSSWHVMAEDPREGNQQQSVDVAVTNQLVCLHLRCGNADVFFLQIFVEQILLMPRSFLGSQLHHGFSTTASLRAETLGSFLWRQPTCMLCPWSVDKNLLTFSTSPIFCGANSSRWGQVQRERLEQARPMRALSVHRVLLSMKWALFLILGNCQFIRRKLD